MNPCKALAASIAIRFPHYRVRYWGAWLCYSVLAESEPEIGPRESLAFLDYFPAVMHKAKDPVGYAERQALESYLEEIEEREFQAYLEKEKRKGVSNLHFLHSGV
tara:strand:+ start:225 stop:539 length:315 start_codon:yes stop_codon:yes gene_type:complete